jgi:hypothetical protein
MKNLKRRKSLNNLKILKLVKDGNNNMISLINELYDFPESKVRQTVWSLIDCGKIVLTEKRTLVEG